MFDSKVGTVWFDVVEEKAEFLMFGFSYKLTVRLDKITAE